MGLGDQPQQARIAGLPVKLLVAFDERGRIRRLRRRRHDRRQRHQDRNRPLHHRRPRCRAETAPASADQKNGRADCVTPMWYFSHFRRARRRFRHAGLGAVGRPVQWGGMFENLPQ